LPFSSPFSSLSIEEADTREETKETEKEARRVMAKKTTLKRNNEIQWL
jgi:hypothetical protein